MKATPPANNAGSLGDWLTSDAAAGYFGGSFQLKMKILAQVIAGGCSQRSIAKAHGISPQAVNKHARKAREAWGINLAVDFPSRGTK